MAKDISLLGADYQGVPAVELPQTGGGTATFYDIQVVDNLTSTSTTDALSANQGRVLNEKTTKTTNQIATGLYSETIGALNIYCCTRASIPQNGVAISSQASLRFAPCAFFDGSADTIGLLKIENGKLYVTDVSGSVVSANWVKGTIIG